jgi:nitrite reductase (cytochrome c-552)
MRAYLVRKREVGFVGAIVAIVAAKAAGMTDEQLAEVMDLHWKAQMRWDFVSSENSTGFHSPQEAARILADAIDLARQAELAAVKLLSAEELASLTAE